jgi:hypothetical protein
MAHKLGTPKSTSNPFRILNFEINPALHRQNPENSLSKNGGEIHGPRADKIWTVLG